MGGAQAKAYEVDFENATPSPSEQQLYSRISALLDRGGSLVNLMQNYVDCSDAIREAMSGGADAAKEELALGQVSQRVSQMKEWFDFSKEMEDAAPQLLSELAKAGDLSAHAGLALLLSRVLEFILLFDEIKMRTPKILNDLAYYRRCLGKARSMPASSMQPHAAAAGVGIDDAGRCQMFLSAPTPMMNAVSAATMRLHHADDAVLGTLPAMANSCCLMVSKKKFAQNVNERCMRAMVGAIVLYDHVHPQGAFHKKTPIHLRKCIQLLKVFDSPPPPPVLLDTLRYSTRHVDDDTTPTSIKKLLNG